MGIDARMFIKTTSVITKEQVHKLSYDLASAFGYGNFFITRPDDKNVGYESHHCLEIIEEYEQDGPTIYPNENETFIEVNLWTRYYGFDYERGDIVLILSVAKWLKQKIVNSSIWYGGDSSGVEAIELTETEIENLWNHFVDVGHEPYSRYFSNALSTNSNFCNFCKVQMVQYGFGGSFQAFHCKGCGYDIETRDGGKTFTEREKK